MMGTACPRTGAPTAALVRVAVTASRGEISTKELEGLIKLLGYYPMKGMINEALKTVDTDGTGEVNVKEFLLLLKIYKATDGFSAAELEELWKVFTKFDRDKSSEVCTDETRSVIKYLGYKPSRRAVAKLVQEVDTDRSGKLSFFEFRKISIFLFKKF